jgi:hypothetical protein
LHSQIDREILILLLPNEHLINPILPNGQIVPLSYDSFQGNFRDGKEKSRIKTHAHGI